MTLKVYRLRRMLAVTAVLFTVVVAGMYFYARSKAKSVLNQIPGIIGVGIKQTATGFQFSKSDGKRTLFTIQASDLKEFKLNGRAELHNVSIVLYGRDSSRFDQIYGDDFSYDQTTGDVTAKGDVQIDLVANPAGLVSPDQSTPKELKNPIHLKTRDLVFNRETGNASTDAKVEFRTPQSTGSAVGVKYLGKTNELTLSSQIQVVLSGSKSAVVHAERGVMTNTPRQIMLERPRLERESGSLAADQAVFYLDADNNVERVLATGNVTTDTRAGQAKGSSPGAEPSLIHASSEQAEFLLTGKQDLLHTATLSGNVHVLQTGAQPMQGSAGRVVLDFAGQNQLQKVHALGDVHLTQNASGNKLPDNVSGKTPGKSPGGVPRSAPQDFELTAAAIDFTVADGHILRHAVTSGAAQIMVSQTEAQGAKSPSSQQRTVVTAGKFDADFVSSDGKSHLATVHGAPDARIVSSAAGQPDRVSTSDMVDAVFLQQGGIESIVQQGNLVYTDAQGTDKQMQAWADRARYTPADQMLVLTGNPKVASGGRATSAMTTTATTILMNRATGEALAEGDVKSTYSELKEQMNGALLASSSPIHVTAQKMTAHGGPGQALYSGNARLWQDANIIQAPSIQFDRDRRSVTAQGKPDQPVLTILVETEKGQPSKSAAESSPNGGKALEKTGRLRGSSPISITATRLTYADAERKIHYEGDVMAKGSGFNATAQTVDAYLLPRSQTSANQSFAGPGQLDKMIAQGNVVITEPNRRAQGQNLVYTAADNKFVLTGGPPSIFDAEQGKITGVSLTFFRRDDRVLVEGEARTPVVTQTRVAH